MAWWTRLRPRRSTSWHSARAGLPWKGHTDLLAHLTGAHRVAMMFWSEPLKVVLASVHVPLAEVPRVLTRELVDEIIDITARELPGFGISAPRLALAGLNPHAGEDGLIGGEEQQVLRPAVDAARARGINIAGPFPGDTIFVRAVRGEFDAVIACYHDQGLIPVKLLAFGTAVNVTLGLPIIRTSVDHGTAFDIAGKGIADPSSMIEATLLAARLATARRSTGRYRSSLLFETRPSRGPVGTRRRPRAGRENHHRAGTLHRDLGHRSRTGPRQMPRSTGTAPGRTLHRCTATKSGGCDLSSSAVAS